MGKNGRVPRRILHTSDLHMEKLNDLASQCLEALVTLGIGAKVDLLVIAGDFFDNNRVDNNLVNFVINQLQRLPGSTLIVPGNHDCLVPDSVYNRAELWRAATKVRIFRAPEGEMLDLPEIGMSVWGRPIVSYEGDTPPLSGMPEPIEDSRWHIAVAHGYFIHPQARLWASFHITSEEINASGQDYVALGDAHDFRCVGADPVKAYYSGSPTMCGKVTIVDLSEKGVEVTPCALWREQYDDWVTPYYDAPSRP